MKKEKTKSPPSQPVKPRNLRELGQAILAECDPVKAGSELLQASSESVKIRALETFAGWSFGSPANGAAGTAGDKAAVRIVWDILAPAHEKGPS
jgi:hypothetical protein